METMDFYTENGFEGQNDLES